MFYNKFILTCPAGIRLIFEMHKKDSCLPFGH